MFHPLPPGSRLVIEHAGGPLDGYHVATDSSNADEVQWATSVYSLTEGCTVGKMFFGLPPERFVQLLKLRDAYGPHDVGLQAPRYRVAGRTEKDGAVCVRLEFDGFGSDDAPYRAE